MHWLILLLYCFLLNKFTLYLLHDCHGITDNLMQGVRTAHASRNLAHSDPILCRGGSRIIRRRGHARESRAKFLRPRPKLIDHAP